MCSLPLADFCLRRRVYFLAVDGCEDAQHRCPHRCTLNRGGVQCRVQCPFYPARAALPPGKKPLLVALDREFGVKAIQAAFCWRTFVENFKPPQVKCHLWSSFSVSPTTPEQTYFANMANIEGVSLHFLIAIFSLSRLLVCDHGCFKGATLLRTAAETRWTSTVDMLQSFVKNKPCIQKTLQQLLLEKFFFPAASMRWGGCGKIYSGQMHSIYCLCSNLSHAILKSFKGTTFHRVRLSGNSSISAKS